MSDKEKLALKAYKKTINKIDDFFEYTNESKKDRAFIHLTLDNLTNALMKIYKPEDRLYYGGGFCAGDYYECAQHKTHYPKGACCPLCENELAETLTEEIEKVIAENGSCTWKELCEKEEENLCPKHKVPVPKWEACPLCEGEN